MLQVEVWVEATVVQVACLGATKVYTNSRLLHNAQTKMLTITCESGQQFNSNVSIALSQWASLCVVHVVCLFNCLCICCQFYTAYSNRHDDACMVLRHMQGWLLLIHAQLRMSVYNAKRLPLPLYDTFMPCSGHNIAICCV